MKGGKMMRKKRDEEGWDGMRVDEGRKDDEKKER